MSANIEEPILRNIYENIIEVYISKLLNVTMNRLTKERTYDVYACNLLQLKDFKSKLNLKNRKFPLYKQFLFQ